MKERLIAEISLLIIQGAATGVCINRTTLWFYRKVRAHEGALR